MADDTTGRAIIDHLREGVEIQLTGDSRCGKRREQRAAYPTKEAPMLKVLTRGRGT